MRAPAPPHLTRRGTSRQPIPPGLPQYPRPAMPPTPLAGPRTPGTSAAPLFLAWMCLR